MLITLKKLPLILVEWDDSSIETDWIKEDEAEPLPIRTFSVGWRLKSDKLNLLIVSTRAANEKCTDRLTIPLGSIRKISKVKEE